MPTIDELPTKLAVVEIRGLLTGRDCPHMKDLQRRKTTHQLAFSLALDSVEVSSLDFVAPDEQVFDYWTDGINALLGKLQIQFTFIISIMNMKIIFYFCFFTFVQETE